MPPIVPCSSVNSRTMSVVRSTLASRAAFAAAAAVDASAESVSRAIHPATCSIRSAFSRCAPELPVKQHRPEPFDAGLQRRLSVRLPEEPRVTQARGDDPLGIAGDRSLVVGLGVDDREKRVPQLPIVAFDRKVMLVMDQ